MSRRKKKRGAPKPARPFIEAAMDIVREQLAKTGSPFVYGIDADGRRIGFAAHSAPEDLSGRDVLQRLIAAAATQGIVQWAVGIIAQYIDGSCVAVLHLIDDNDQMRRYEARVDPETETIAPWVLAEVGDPDPQVCRLCGCTDDHACTGGCHWVTDDLCSACLESLPTGRALAWWGMVVERLAETAEADTTGEEPGFTEEVAHARRWLKACATQWFTVAASTAH